MKKTRALLILDPLSGKVTGVEKYSGDGEGKECYIDSMSLLKHAKRRGKDVFFEDGNIVFRDRDPEIFGNKLDDLKENLTRLRRKERKIFSEYNLGKYGSTAAKRLSAAATEAASVKAQIEELEGSRAEQVRKAYKAKTESAKFKYDLSVCLITRNDNASLREWLEFHMAQGAEHFYIYDHASDTPVETFIASLPPEISSGVEVIDFSGSHGFAQHDAYNDCLRRAAGVSRWVAFLDADEMIHTADFTDLKEFLKGYEDYAGVFVGWVQYGACGRIERGEGSVRERFPTPLPDELCNQKGVGKVVVQPLYMAQMLTHNGYPVEGFKIVDSDFRETPRAAAWADGLTTDKILIDHYYTKSYEEWKEKMSRGTCDPYYSRKYEEFFELNPDLIRCRETVYPKQQYENFNKEKQEK